MFALWQRETPLGRLTLISREGALCALEFAAGEAELSRRFVPPGAGLKRRPVEAIDQALTAYFGGEVGALDAVPVVLEGTGFQRAVWAALRRIPVGQTWTYARLAREVGKPTAMRAVGAANGRNPVALVVPCHRVIATGGKLGGYAGGLDRKAWLLRHEGAQRV
ncbi:MAG: methylated-DNA--[protein]-cysteine S-methyltransferase [Myxococcota bacterium]|nr:methylated-DNA--[protein]-cysteine S-methyltransferase [Myxococcota bacterium]